jgi:DNA-directed RNA polymerase specialized sigma24 family protein
MVDKDDFYYEFECVDKGLLSDNQIDVIYMRYVLGMSFGKIALETGRLKRSVIRSHNQAMKKIEECLKCE